ncbi:hypothetical protein B5M44_04140 [Shinella sumterensis]|uniref:DEAD/DEAH box helicase n=1 Tax=Shinella sumterensis TaxID=1967501 RepID=UPI00106E1664|nr:DEAD/DEAH box helicase [Shinella sumterensis]MCD1264069.1 DEAD/DEAH box helicase family protein [Shinella sumterensis]TFE99400.1 hypothetical protein B5M44_04140 [Shinella sumterensis]
MTLRKYQAKSVEKTLAALERSGSAVLQMPTGAGKTKTAMEIVAGHEGVVWFLCHRKEIIRQTAKAFREAGIDFGVISPAKDTETGKRYEFQPEKRVQIASVGSICRRIGKLPAPSLVIWDECHHTPAASWRDIRDKTQAAKHVGLTATPERQDGAGLRELFDEMIVGPSIKELVDEGWLSGFRYFAPSEPDLSAARMQAGDYRKDDIEKVMNTPVLIGDAVSEYKKSIPGKRALVFAVSVDASRALVEKFREEGIAAAHVDANTPDDERDAAVADLASGEICVLSNVEVFTEGFDIPAIDAVILMRPTRSVRLLLQMIGRVLRIAEGKDCAMIFDHAGLYHEHGWFADNWAWSLDGGAAKERRKALERGPRKCPECKEVRAEREPVCACGFEFPMGREIGEFDGALREIRGEVPEGCETRKAFARRWGVSHPTLQKWVGMGMPLRAAVVPIDDANTWVEANVDLGHLKDRQRRNDARNNSVIRLDIAAKRLNVPRRKVSAWIARGLPTVGDLVKWPDAIKWVEDNVSAYERHDTLPLKDNNSAVTIASFARLFDVAETTASSWVKRGLPHDGLLVPVAAGREWVSRNVDFEQLILFNSAKRCTLGVDNASSFARRIGRNIKIVKTLRRQGVPTHGKLIPIREALEWVRDNRPDIVIPPEAWPSANDNTASTKAA